MGTSRRPSRDAYRALAVAAVFMIAVFFDQYTVRFLAGPPTSSREAVKAEGARFMLALTATRLFGLFLVLHLIRARSNTELRDSLRLERWSRYAAAVAITVACAFLLNQFDVYPFPWRWQYDQNVNFVRVFAETGHPLALVFALFVSAVASPIIEEVIFRFGLLRSLQAWTQSSTLAVLGSAVIFGAAHLGYPFWRPTEGDIRNACGAAGLGIVLAAVVVRSNGRISVAIAIHSTYNLIVGAMLGVTALSS